MSTLVQVQHESHEWRVKNFPPEHRTAPLQALGVCEEAGELAHAVLKMTQGIRGTEEDHLAEVADAVGDIVIYLAGLCSELGLDLNQCVAMAWDQVKKRKWQENKVDGSGEDTHPSDIGINT